MRHPVSTSSGAEQPVGAERRALLRADGSWTEDTTRVVREPGVQAFVAGDIVPLATFVGLAPAERAGLGVWLAPDSDPAALREHVNTLSLIAVDFPAFKDGRGLSIAALLRARFGFRGDLRAIGDVVIDLVFYLRRVGFSSFALRPGLDPAAATAALKTFSDVYQASVDQPLPYFRRRMTPTGAA